MNKATIQQLIRDLKHNQDGALTFSDGTHYYTRRFQPPQRLILLGGGHIAQALCVIASYLEYRVTVVDDRPSFANEQLFPDAKEILCDDFPSAIAKLKIQSWDDVAVLTRGHRWDGDCLREIFKGTMPSYLGLVGSKRRVTGLFQLLEEEGFDRSLMQQIHTPIGLDIGAGSPKEIAIAIIAELIDAKRNEDREEVDFSLLQDLAGPEERAVCVVTGSRGSVPAEIGAMMSADRHGRVAGTIGGGCGEFEAMRAARRVLQTGEAEQIEIDMTDDVAASEGMVCGGRMEVLIEPCRNDSHKNLL